jgi:aspartate aminotransferase
MLFATRLESLTESQTLAMAKQVRVLKAQGLDIVSMTLGEPDFDTPMNVRKAGIRAIEEGFTHYPPVAGIPELRKAISDKFQRDNGLEYAPEQIIVSAGAKQSLINALMSLVNPGDEVIIPTPYWVSYLPMVQLAEGTPVLAHARTQDNLKLTPELLAQHLSPKTRVLMLNSPNNPTGMVYSRGELEAICAVLKDWPNVTIIADEIYEHIRYDVEHISMASIAGMYERTLTVNGFSKAYAMTGWRVGYASGPKELIQLCERYQGQITSGCCSIAQRAAAEALTGPQDDVYMMRNAFRKRRDLAVKLFAEKLPEVELLVPDGAFYLYPDLKAYVGRSANGKQLKNGDDFAMYLLDNAHLATVSGVAFGSETHLRLSYACSEEQLRKGIERMAAGLAQLV